MYNIICNGEIYLKTVETVMEFLVYYMNYNFDKQMQGRTKEDLRIYEVWT
jgi:hypothetical protein